MGFPEADAARHSRAGAGNNVRIAAIQIEADVKAGGIPVHDLQGAARHLGHPELIDIPHREGGNSRLTNKLALHVVDVAYADQDNIVAINGRPGAEDAG